MRRARLVAAFLALVGIVGESVTTFSTPDRGWINTLEFGGFGLLAGFALLSLLALNSDD